MNGSGPIGPIARIGAFLGVLLLGPTGPLAAGAAERGASAPVRSPRAEVRLVAEALPVRPDEPFLVGLHFELTDGWHVYWKNPGDSGTAPDIDWTLPPGWSAGEIRWPYPERLPLGPFVNFGYEDEIVLPVRIEPAAGPGSGAASAAPLRLEADARWLVCKEDCIPERGSFALELPVARDAPQPTRWAAAFAHAAERLPVELAGVTATVTDAGDGTLWLRVEHPAELALDDAEIEFFPATPATVEHAAPATVERDERAVTLGLARSPFATGEVTAIDGVLVARPRGPHDSGTVALALRAGPGPAAAPATAEALVGRAGQAAGGGPGLLAAMGLALLGGLLLNLMPCVFPVISIKILSLLEHGGDRTAGRRHGLLFAAGIVVSFWILAGVLLALRAAGRSVGWGFQLQSPLLLGLLALLFFGLGLVFLGVLEVGGTLAGRAASSSRRGGATGAFLSGMLATLVATPCTAPFMGTAIGFAVVVTPPVALAVFTALGLGMAAPYVALVLVPGALRLLPRPGRWMETLKQMMAFPLFATVLWLLWVLSAQTGSSGVLAALGGLLLVGFAAWLAGRWGDAPGMRRAVALGTAALAMASAVWLVVPRGVPDNPVADGGTAEAAPGEMAWIAWSPDVVERLRAEGRPVYVDFTARWCLTCQVNKTVVFGSAEVRRAFSERDVALVRADWTSQDPRITRALEAFGRSGVPLNVYYPPDPAAEPRVLPSLLQPGIVLEAMRAS